MATSQWWQKAVIYQIYPKSFNDSNGDGIGDLPGITAKLDYLKELGIDAIWISPIYTSPQVDSGYDISDYRVIDPRFGTNADLYHLIDEAHARGIKVIMDLVANHTSDQHVWFQQSRQSRDNYFSDFYIWRDPQPDGSAPSNWGSYFGGSAWEYEPLRQQYYLHYFAKEQPDLNWENPLVRTAVYDLMRFWKAHGVDGWRMDVISGISKFTDFPDYPTPNGEQFVVGDLHANGPRLHEFLQEMNREVLAPFDMMSVGEAPGSTARNARQFVDQTRQELNMVFTFDHMDIDADPMAPFPQKFHSLAFDLVKLKQSLSEWQNSLFNHGWNTLYFENHDQPRVISRWGNDGQYRYQSATAFATVLHGLQGTPYVFEGEEIGMTNARNFTLADYNDIEVTNTAKMLGTAVMGLTATELLAAAQQISRDNARTPMQWDNSANAGFTTGQPWLKINSNFPTINVTTDRQQTQSVFNYYQQLIALRHDAEWLTAGEYQLLLSNDPQLFAYTRTYAGQVWLIVANLSPEIVATTALQAVLGEQKITQLLLQNYPERQRLDAALQPYEALIAKLG
ncbi:glycoside hydrolase family 13 protein [Loigolactobacillus zhaoyuanensis]|uniref:glycoside hydrolase family 13 protein n=1 Tax=Loigolactobacillus zhaoyuanensis TaxID=2486017 RepID=UPI000F7452B9|nr:alpha-glucosidase [Loigolactobacillus zhaoyuanensis]